MHENKQREPKIRLSGAELKKRHRKNLRRRKIMIMFTRMLSVAFIIFVTLTVVLYLNPIFNIRTVNTEGNEHVDMEYLEQGISGIRGKNIFRVTKKSVFKQFAYINYFEDVNLKKSYFPPELTIIFTEYKPCGTAKIGDKFYLFDENLKILEESSAFIESAPKVYGTDDIPLNEFVKDSKNNKVTAMLECFSKMEETGVLEKVTEISFESISNITFEYDGKFHVILGSAYDVDAKLRLFLTALSNANIPENAMGTMDLSTGGTAYLRPDVQKQTKSG